MSDTHLRQERLQIYFFLTALFHVASIASAFPPFEAKLPGDLPAVILWAHFPVLFFGGYLQGRTETGDDKKSDFPLWMRLDGVARFSFAFAVSYLFIVITKNYQLSLGPVDPLNSPGKDLSAQLQWYGMWSIGAAMLLAMGPAGTLVAGLQIITYPARRLPALIAIPLVFAVGIGAGFLALRAITSSQVNQAVHTAYDLNERFAEISAGMLSILAVVTFLYKLLLAPKTRE